MEEIIKNTWTIVAVILSSSVIAALINNFVTGYRNRRPERKKLDMAIKNLAHDIQEENEYYKSLLMVEARWYGKRYSLYLSSIRNLTGEAMRKAWQMDGDPSAVMESSIKLNHKKIEELSDQFSLDSRRFLCPLKRTWMAIHDKILGVKKYNV